MTKRFNFEPIMYTDSGERLTVVEGRGGTRTEGIVFTVKKHASLTTVDWTPSEGTMYRLQADKERGVKLEDLLSASIRRKSGLHLRNLAESVRN